MERPAVMKPDRPFSIPCLLAVCCLLAACQTMTEHVVPDPKHAEKSVQEAVADVFDGLARTRRDIEKAFRTGGSGDRGRVFVHVRGSGVSAELARLLRRRIGNLLEDAGYEIVPFGELAESIGRQADAAAPSWDDRTAQRAARALNAHEGAGALDVHVTSVSSVGLGELSFEGKYEEELEIEVTTAFYEASWGDEVLRDRASLSSRSVYRQAERYYSEKILGMSTRDRNTYRLLVDKVRTLLPRLPERAR